MRKISLLFVLWLYTGVALTQTPSVKPCAVDPMYRQFDFWIGEWDVFGLKGKQVGNSKIDLILDSCIILENWTSIPPVYSGKSFNTYNAATKQWQQTWVDNAGGSNEYLEGKYENNKMTFLTKPFPFSKDTMGIRRLTFHPLAVDKVRQHGELSKDNGTTWNTEYDLEYRRRK